eukprot:scaffold14995_cov92-Cylindrotheca_fusiformis.AAC.3
MERADMDESTETEERQPEYFVYSWISKFLVRIRKETLTHLRVDFSVRAIPERAFKDCQALTHVLLPETLSRIGESAFRGCEDLSFVQFVSRSGSLVIPSIKDSIKDASIVFPERKKLQIDKYAFSNCYSLRIVVVCSVSTILGEGVFQCCLSLISVELPEGLEVIETRLFAHCNSLTTLRLPSSVNKIGDCALNGCGMTSIDLPPGRLEIGTGCIAGCASIENLHVPLTVSAIGESTFSDCQGLKNIKLPPTLKRIKPLTFNWCLSLEYIEIPTTVVEIGDFAFAGCISLSHIRIPPSVNSRSVENWIRRGTFSNCSSLISIELPEGIPLEDLDIHGCRSLVNVAARIHVEPNFYPNLRLSIVVDNAAGLKFKLEHRFDNCPLNKLCYYQSYHSLEDAMMQLHSLMEDDPLAATTQVDEFGMTPLHILSLSQTTNLDMLLAVMDAGDPGHMGHSRDSFGSTPMDYLCLNRKPNFNEVIRRVLQRRFGQILGLDLSWKSDVMQAVDEALSVDWSSRRRSIVMIYWRLENYERKEVFSFLELYLWKMKIDEVMSNRKDDVVDRQRCRIMSGAAIVIPHVLPFLEKIDLDG